jgi:hypothetical protein
MRSSLPETDKLPDTEKLSPRPETGDQPVPDAPKPTASVVSSPPATSSDSLDDYKMMAEPLKDMADEEVTQDFTPISDDTIDKVISMRPSTLTETPVYEAVPPVVEKESQAEGRDTLLPDQ